MLVLWYTCTTWTLTKKCEEELNVNFTKMLWVVLNKLWL